MMDAIYTGLTGFMNLKQKYDSDTVNTIYGELTHDSMVSLLKMMRLTKDDVLVDIGCGVGKFVMMAATTTPAKVRGIEVVTERYEAALKACEIAHKTLNFPASFEDKCTFINADATKCDLSDATVVYMCSTLFPDKAMERICEQVPAHAILVSQKKLPWDSMWKLNAMVVLPCSWSEQVIFHFYTHK